MKLKRRPETRTIHGSICHSHVTCNLLCVQQPKGLFSCTAFPPSRRLTDCCAVCPTKINTNNRGLKRYHSGELSYRSGALNTSTERDQVHGWTVSRYAVEFGLSPFIEDGFNQEFNNIIMLF